MTTAASAQRPAPRGLPASPSTSRCAGACSAGPPRWCARWTRSRSASTAGTTLGLVGESGCGKTTTSKLVLGLERPTAGAIRFEGADVPALDRASDGADYRRSVQAVFQDPYASLDPRMRVGAIIAEPLVINERTGAAARRRRVQELLDLVGLPERSADLFPHEFSGGQRQRIAIARALALSPRLVVLDEPVSALDVSIRAQILNLLRDLQKRLDVAYLFIAHDLAAVAHMSHTIAVMYLGQIVEWGEAAAVALAPKHPYTQALFAAALPIDVDENARGDRAVRRGAEPARSPRAAAASTRAAPRHGSLRDGRAARSGRRAAGWSPATSTRRRLALPLIELDPARRRSPRGRRASARPPPRRDAARAGARARCGRCRASPCPPSSGHGRRPTAPRPRTPLPSRARSGR